jgi:amidase
MVEEVATDDASSIGDAELTVLLCELHDDLDAYLGGRPGSPVRSLADVVEFNAAHAQEELAHFGQELLDAALATNGRADASYADARERCVVWAHGCLDVLDRASGPEVLIAPAYAPAWKSDLVNGDQPAGGGRATAAPSIAGWPVLCLPMGFVDGLPVGLLLIGRPRSERRLLAIGDAIERHLGLVERGALVPTWLAPGRG